MNANGFNVRLAHKLYCIIRTESGFFEVSESIIKDNGLVPDAVSIPASTVADLVAQAERQRQQQQKPRGKVRKKYKIRRFQKEVV